MQEKMAPQRVFYLFLESKIKALSPPFPSVLNWQCIVGRIGGRYIIVSIYYLNFHAIYVLQRDITILILIIL